MLSCFLRLALFKKQTTQIDVGVDVSWVQRQGLSVVGNRLFAVAVFFQERAIAIVRLRRVRRQTNGRFTFRSRLVLATELVQKIGVAGMIFSVARLDPQSLLKMALCRVE